MFEESAEAGADMLFEARKIQDEEERAVGIDRVLRTMKEERLRLRQRRDPDDQ